MSEFNKFADSIRQQHNRNRATTNTTPLPEDLETAKVYRKMNFIKSQAHPTQPLENMAIENYIYQTKITVSESLPKIFHGKRNLTKKETSSIKKLKNTKDLTIKAADKNLGIVVMNSEDYVDQIISHLSSDTYRIVKEFPPALHELIENTILSFKTHIEQFNKRLYKWLQPTQTHRIPKFYGVPKIHKPFTNKGIPPLRPIVSHVNSILSHSAKLLDHLLQPLAKTYPDYLHNSTQLIHTLATLKVPPKALLATLDIVSLFPSIPQSECLNTVYEEMHTHQNLFALDPNFVIQLLNVNIQNNYFEFANIIFKQVRGTAMGTPFSPTIANIYMSVYFRKFFSKSKWQPLLFVRYIDDIFIVWPDANTWPQFLNELNHYHPDIKFTSNHSTLSIDYLDITIYKRNSITDTTLGIKTFQKPNNLYQYLDFTSNHPRHIYKGLLIGECKRYARTNTDEANYDIQVELFKQRLLKRNYPIKFIQKYTKQVHFAKRAQYINPERKPPTIINRPVFKFTPPPQYSHLRHIILHKYDEIKQSTPTPLLIALKPLTLGKLLIRAQYHPSNNEMMDILIACHDNTTKEPNISLPIKKTTKAPHQCRHPRCCTCQHLDTRRNFTSTATKQTFRVRHTFSCNSRNVVYLITCKKCKKQYTGMTTNTLRERVNHHRTTINTRENRYVSKHFNFKNHCIKDLKVQVIDKSDNITDLRKLEKFWIQTLNTIEPYGLNVIT